MSNPEAGAVAEALARLDQDIADEERTLAAVQQRLSELRTMRESIRPFFERYVGTGSLLVQAAVLGTGNVTSFTDRVVQVFQQRPDAVLDVDEVLKHLQDNGVESTREAV